MTRTGVLLPAWDKLKTDEQRLEKIRHHVESQRNFNFPVPAPWVTWLLEYKTRPEELFPPLSVEARDKIAKGTDHWLDETSHDLSGMSKVRDGYR